MRLFVIIVSVLILQPFVARAQAEKHYSERDRWLAKRYKDSIGLSTDMADSIVSIERASMRVYYKMLSDYNRCKAEGQIEIPFPDLKKTFTEGSVRIKEILTPTQFNIWRRLQIGKYDDYSKPGINVYYLRGYPDALRKKIIAHVHVSPVVADSLLMFAQEYQKRLTMIWQASGDARKAGADIRKSINHLNAEAKRVLNNDQYLDWINWQDNKAIK